MKRGRAAATAWSRQAAWYDRRQGDEGDSHHRELVLPAVLRALAPKAGQHLLDCCCGQGVLGRLLAAQGCRVTGIDAAAEMIAAARERAGQDERYLLGDARELDRVLADESFDHAALVLAAQDLDPLAPVLTGMARRVPLGGRLVMVLTHPCFRVPRASDWGRDAERRIVYRRVEGYRSERCIKVRMGGQIVGSSFHRPLSYYLQALGESGWAVIGAEEPVAPWRGSAGTWATAEQAAAGEFPLFLVLTACRVTVTCRVTATGLGQ